MIVLTASQSQALRWIDEIILLESNSGVVVWTEVFNAVGARFNRIELGGR